MDKQKADRIAAVLGEHLDKLNAALLEQGLDSKVKRGNGTFSDTSLSIKLTFEDIVGGVVQTREAADFAFNTDGIDPKRLNVPFSVNGTTYVLTGYSVRSRRYPYLITVNGKSLKATAAHVKSLIEQSAAAPATGSNLRDKVEKIISQGGAH
jgi:hypothetical protein